MGRPESFRLVQSCFSCRHTFVREEYDEGHQLFCCQDGSARPPCGSVSMSEGFLQPDIRAKTGLSPEKLRAAWDAWSEEHAVAEFGVCDEWDLGETKDDQA